MLMTPVVGPFLNSCDSVRGVNSRSVGLGFGGFMLSRLRQLGCGRRFLSEFGSFKP